MGGRLQLPDGGVARTACARALVRAGVDERTGEVLPAAVVAERVGWCAGLVRGMAAGLLAGRVLRSACWRAALTAGLLATWPARPLDRTPQEWDAVRAAMPGGKHLPGSVIKARTRQVLRFLAAEGRLPRDVFDLEPPPGAPGVLLLAACDRQQATLERSPEDPRRVLLRVQLPVRPDPRSYQDWTWVALPLALPPTVPPGAVLHLPALRIAGGRARADLAFTHAVPEARRAGHVVALGVDWGLNTLLSAGTTRLHGDGTITALGAGAQYRAAGVLAKQHRLRRHAEHLQAKADQYGRLTAGDARHPLNAKRAVLAEEIHRVSERRSSLNDALAWSAARWATDQAIAAGATVIYLEDLRSMEAKGMGRTLSTRLSQTVRGKIAARIRHLAAEVGIAVVTVPPRGTSRNCPRCLAPLRHATAPDRPHTSGWKWAICPDPECGWQGDRDQDVHATSTPITRPHRARGAALGAGFHLHAHATPPRWETTPQDPRVHRGSLSKSETLLDLLGAGSPEAVGTNATVGGAGESLSPVE